jgi:Ferritin-like domain
MKVTFATLLAFATLSTSFPVIRRATPTENQILNFALTLEHLENNFYSTFLSKFNADDFKAAGFEPFVHGRMLQIANHEANHVQFLENYLGPEATKACTYSFPVKSVKDFVALSQIFEGVGTTAYLGAAHFLHTPSLVTAAASILTTEYVLFSFEAFR